MSDLCTDNRFELIEKYKQKLIEYTNIESALEEMEVIDNILFRFWQVGWLESIDRMSLVKESAKTLIHSVGNSVSAKVLRNAGRLIQNAIDGKAPEFESVEASSGIPNSSDIISRQDAVKAIDKYIHAFDAIDANYLDGLNTAKGLVNELPSVQAEPNYDEWCTDCKEYNQEQHCCPRWNRVIRETLKDIQPEIIRCKECKYKKVYRFPPKYNEMDYCEEHEKIVDVADFCSWAERRE